jgi:hypothetical protein
MLQVIWSAFRRDGNMDRAGATLPAFLTRWREQQSSSGTGASANASNPSAFHLFLSLVAKTLPYYSPDDVRRGFFSRIVVHLPAQPRAIAEVCWR